MSALEARAGDEGGYYRRMLVKKNVMHGERNKGREVNRPMTDAEIIGEGCLLI